MRTPLFKARANPERNFQMAEAKWPVCTEEAKANVHRPWPCADDTADRPLRPGRLPSTSERIAWERAGAARGLWLCCVGRPSLGGKKGSHPFLGIGLPPRLARDPSALPPFRKFLSGFALESVRSHPCRRVYWVLGLAVGDGVAAGCGAKLLSMSMTLSGVVFPEATRIFQSSLSRTKIIHQ